MRAQPTPWSLHGPPLRTSKPQRWGGGGLVGEALLSRLSSRVKLHPTALQQLTTPVQPSLPLYNRLHLFRTGRPTSGLQGPRPAPLCWLSERTTAVEPNTALLPADLASAAACMGGAAGGPCTGSRGGVYFPNK